MGTGRVARDDRLRAPAGAPRHPVAQALPAVLRGVRRHGHRRIERGPARHRARTQGAGLRPAGDGDRRRPPGVVHAGLSAGVAILVGGRVPQDQGTSRRRAPRVARRACGLRRTGRSARSSTSSASCSTTIRIFAASCFPRTGWDIRSARTTKTRASSGAPTTSDERRADVALQIESRTPALDDAGHPVEELVVNVGPSHPSTHGVGRVIVHLDGDVVVKVDPVIGYLHRGIEKMAENRTYLQIVPLTDRLDYVGSMYANWAYCRAVERLAGIRVPERAEYIRVIVCELQRIASHMMGIGLVGGRHRRLLHVHLRVRRPREDHRAVRGPLRLSAHLQLRTAGRSLQGRSRGLGRPRHGVHGESARAARGARQAVLRQRHHPRPAQGRRRALGRRTRWRGAPRVRLRAEAA